jgi:thiosulfate dehydrogenase (quinone) large subunit
MEKPSQDSPYSARQLWLLTALRMAIGWHFLYEGVVKLWNPGWSAGGYLMDSSGPLAGLFQSMASTPQILSVVDVLNAWGLTLVGLGLLMGGFTRLAAIGGIILLAFYYLAHPPLFGAHYASPTEGSYLLVNKNLIELLAIAVLCYFPTGHLLGLDRLLRQWPVTSWARKMMDDEHDAS